MFFIMPLWLTNWFYYRMTGEVWGNGAGFGFRRD